MQQSEFSKQLFRFYGVLAVAFGLVVGLIALLESWGMPKVWVGYLFIFITIAAYAGIGLLSRTTDMAEYYVASRRVPAFFNGMATGADWMSAASFIGMAGTLYVAGFDGLVYVMGWTGGYVLLALLIAPYLRRHGQFTVPDLVADRFPGHDEGRLPRLIAVIATLICSFIYLVAQIYGVGLITSRFTGVEFGIGIFLGLAGVLVCSFLGGMKAVTWTQVAQYVVMIVAYLIPVSILSMERTGNPIPAVAYGEVLKDISAAERKINADPKEWEVRAAYARRAEQYGALLYTLPASWAEGLEERRAALERVRGEGGTFGQIKAAERAMNEYPQSPEEARIAWTAQRDSDMVKARPPVPHAQPFAPEVGKSSTVKKINFLALMFTLMVGTAALPHILIRFMTTRTVQAARWSVFWSLLFIAALYTTAPALAVLVKSVIYEELVGSSFTHLPAWVQAWGAVDSNLLSLNDINHDGIVQLAEVNIGPDIVMLATPEIAGLPYFVTGLVAAGGLAAALSTADGLLLTISNALSHDVYYKMVSTEATTQKRVTISKIALLIVALSAAWVTSSRPGDILYLVGAAFSLAASSLFPVLVAGIFWRRCSRMGAIASMVTGLSVASVYMLINYRPFMGWFGWPTVRFFDIEPISAAVFAAPAAGIVLTLFSLFGPRDSEKEKEGSKVVDLLRSPEF